MRSEGFRRLVGRLRALEILQGAAPDALYPYTEGTDITAYSERMERVVHMPLHEAREVYEKHLALAEIEFRMLIDDRVEAALAERPPRRSKLRSAVAGLLARLAHRLEQPSR